MSNIKAQTKLNIEDLGLISYENAYQTQLSKLKEVIDGGIPSLLLCEHNPILTFGRMGHEENFLLSKDEIAKKGVEVKYIDRGGDITLHAPGQLVIYPILDLNNYGRDLHQYLHKLEQVAIDLLKCFDIVASRVESKTGAWVGSRKIASIGIGVKKWVSYHGLAINVNTDLNLFRLIRPCGLDVQMTSISDVLSKEINMSEVKEKLIECFDNNFSIGVN